ncbi:response regulator [Caballeronia sp. LZ035]|uniref:response regulator n=1 Tax=Caballeronia sp. LZ035 TaxID=3038568 RepID=UPI002856E44F|nr:response regulator [Caballeronia sp. LZ035]MDR5763455.1 response regulator [Caballeronia sp. LZ035]
MVRVLVVDDEPAIADALSFILSDAGYEVESAADGCLALSKAVQWRPDLILSDLMMPRMGGEELLRHLRQSRDLANVPMVAMSALPPPQGSGFDGFLQKPFSVRAMLGLLGQAVLRG